MSFIVSIAFMMVVSFACRKADDGNLSATNHSHPKTDTSAAEKVIVRIGTIGNEPHGEIRKFQPLVDYLNNNLAQGKFVFKGAAASSVPGMIALFKEGMMDVYIDSPFPTYQVAESVGLVVWLRRWKKGIAEYHSVVFVRKDSRITSLEELKGKVIAFEDRFSTGSYALPKAALIGSGLVLVEQSDPYMSVAGDDVAYVFSVDDKTTVGWVLEREVIAGAMNNLDFVHLTGPRRYILRIIHKTETVPRHLVSYRPGLDPSLVQHLRNALLTMHETENGRKTLRAFEITARFDKIPDEGKLRKSMVDMIKWLAMKERSL